MSERLLEKKISPTYYADEVRSRMRWLAGNLRGYQHVLASLQSLREHAGVPEAELQPTKLGVLGGFYPDRDNVVAFQMLAESVGLPISQLRYVDINAEPAAVLTADEKEQFHQIDLCSLTTAMDESENPIFPPESVQLIVLDYTINFMNSHQLSDFLSQLHTVLSRDGVCLIVTESLMFDTKFFRFFANIRATFSNSVRSHGIPVADLQEKLQQADLRLAYNCEVIQFGGDYRVLAVTRADSIQPVAKFEDNIKM